MVGKQHLFASQTPELIEGVSSTFPSFGFLLPFLSRVWV